MNKTTTYRLLQTLVAAGWLLRTSSGGYKLSMRFLHLGAIARADLDLRNEALPLMRGLAEEFGDTAFLMIPGDEGAVVIEAIVGRNPVRVHTVSVGTVFPYHVAAGPVAIAAYDPKIEARVLLRDQAKMTQRTITETPALKDHYAEVRRLGYAVSIGDYIDDVAAVGAPVLDEDGIAVASISIGGPAHRFDDSRLPSVIGKVREVALSLSAQMGYQ